MNRPSDFTQFGDGSETQKEADPREGDASKIDPRPSVLIVDDQAINIQILHQMLQSEYRLHMARDGFAGLELAQRLQPDAVLLDLVMPGINGLEVLRQLQSDPATRDIPVLMITAHADPEQEDAAYQAGARDFIQKPVRPLALRARLRTLVEWRRLQHRS